MKLIIDIPEEEVNECKRQVDMIKQEGFLIESLNTALKIHVANGTPLPKGHGRLIEITPELEGELFTFTRYTGIDEYPYESATIITDNAPTILEADKERRKNENDN